MEEFTKVEKLVEITGASFEDATSAIRACDGDIVEAMVYLEKLGKVTKNTSTTYVDPRFAPISEAERAIRRAQAHEACVKTRSAFGEFVRKTVRFLTHNRITISKNGQEFASIPLLAAIIICSVSVGFAIVAVFISMMFGYDYAFKGETNFDAANRAMAQVGTAAGNVKAEYDRL